MRFGISFNALKYAERTDRKGKQTIVRHTICISDGLLEEVAEYESKERCMEVMKEFCEAYTDGYYTTEYFDDSAKPQEGIADDVTELIRHFGEDNAETLEKLYQCGIADNLYDNINRLVEIVNPGGSRSYRKGLFFLMFHEDCLKYKKYGQTLQRMEYREFFERILDAFGDEPEEETMEEVTEAEHERTDSEPEREVEELAAEPQRDSRVEREDPESGEHEPERIEQPDQKVEEPEKTVISPAKKTEEKEEKMEG